MQDSNGEGAERLDSVPMTDGRTGMSDGGADSRVCLLSDVVAMESLGLSVLVGHDLDRPVRWVQTTELVDPRVYLRSDELVCTVGASLGDDHACRRFVEAVVSASASAICFGAGDVHDRAPAALVQACRASGLPLLLAPYGLPFLAIADLVAALRAEHSDAVRTGQMVALVAHRLASPLTLGPLLAQANVGTDELLVAAWPEGQARAVARLLPDALVGETAEATFSVGGSLAALASTAEALGLPCGYATPAPLDAVPRSLSLSQLALDVARNTGGVVGPEALATFGGLLAQQTPDRLSPFRSRVIQPLVAAGAGHTPSYLDTLRAFLANDLSVGRTAKAQYLHPNTVRHRLSLVRSLTGHDPFAVDGLLTLAVAVWAHDNEVGPA